MQIKHRAAALVLGIALCLAGCSTRLDKTSEFLKYKDREKIAAIEALCRDYFDQHGLVGLSVGVLVDGHVRFFNLGTLEAGGADITEDTLFDLGTLTEVFTGVTYGESIYRRYLSDGSRLSVLFPYLTLPGWQGESVTLGQLATHRSGFAARPDNLQDGPTPYAGYDELALRRYLSGAQLEIQPGGTPSPGGMDMGLLGFALEAARKLPYEMHVKNVIMYSIGMTRTTITFPKDEPGASANWATPHDAAQNALPHQEYDALQGMAAFKSTAYDLMLFAWCALDMPGTEKTFLKPEAAGWSRDSQLYDPVDDHNRPQFAKMSGVQSVIERLRAGIEIATDPHYQSDSATLGYGFVLDEMHGGRYIWQAGGDAGNGGYLGLAPQADAGVVVLTNTGVQPRALGEAILALVGQAD